MKLKLQFSKMRESQLTMSICSRQVFSSWRKSKTLRTYRHTNPNEPKRSCDHRMCHHWSPPEQVHQCSSVPKDHRPCNLASGHSQGLPTPVVYRARKESLRATKSRSLMKFVYLVCTICRTSNKTLSLSAIIPRNTCALHGETSTNGTFSVIHETLNT